MFSLGYGDFERLDEDDNQTYTDTFEGTSSALPMVVSAAAVLIEAFVAVEGGPPDPLDVRRLLVATGHAQGEGAPDDAPPYGFEGVHLSEGEHSIRARATDAWGNGSWSDPRSISAFVEEKPGASSTGAPDNTSSTEAASSGAGDDGSSDDSRRGGCRAGRESGQRLWVLWGLLLADGWSSRRASSNAPAVM